VHRTHGVPRTGQLFDRGAEREGIPHSQNAPDGDRSTSARAAAACYVAALARTCRRSAHDVTSVQKAREIYWAEPGTRPTE